MFRRGNRLFIRLLTVIYINSGRGIDVINVFTFFILLTFFTSFIFSAIFIFKKTLSKAKYEYAKIQREILLEDASTMIFIDFGLLRSPYCKISYLLTEERWRHRFGDVTCVNTCKFCQIFYQTFTNVFLYFSMFLRFLTFFYFYLNVYYTYGAWARSAGSHVVCVTSGANQTLVGGKLAKFPGDSWPPASDDTRPVDDHTTAAGACTDRLVIFATHQKVDLMRSKVRTAAVGSHVPR